jgi:hypothetical protein
MKRFSFSLTGVGLAVLTVLALSAMAVASTASATTFLLAEWLEGGASITETMLVETTGALLLENEKAPVVGKAAVECSGILVGDIGPDGADDVTEVLNLSKELISSTPLSGTALSCTDEANCESPKVYPVGFPWLTLLELWEQGTENGFVDLLTSQKAGTNIGWYVECTVLGVKASEECTTTTVASSATNVATGVEGELRASFTELMGLKLALCTGNKEETGVIAGSGTTATSLTGTLQVSSGEESSATFLLAEWLEASLGITETMLVETTGELLLENEKAPIVGKVDIVCSGILVGDVGPDGAGDITEVLNLSKELISSTPLEGTGMLCTDDTNCESPKLWPVGLPWLGLLELWETLTPAESGFVLLGIAPAGKVFGWYIECTVLGVKASEECTAAESVASAANVGTGVEATDSDTFTELMGLKLGLCSGNDEETGVLEGSGVTVTSLAGPLTVSE